MTEPKPKSFEHWACVEIMGHQSVVGRCTEEQIAGATLLRVDVPDGDSFVTQYVGGGSIYRLRVVSEEVARKLSASRRDNVPPFAWELQKPERSRLPSSPDEDDEALLEGHRDRRRRAGERRLIQLNNRGSLMGNRFTKIGAEGEKLADDATEWVAVIDSTTEPRLDGQRDDAANLEEGRGGGAKARYRRLRGLAPPDGRGALYARRSDEVLAGDRHGLLSGVQIRLVLDEHSRRVLAGRVRLGRQLRLRLRQLGVQGNDVHVRAVRASQS